MAIEEEWRDIVGYEGIYQVSNIGRVKRVKVGKGKPYRILQPMINKNYYLVLKLCSKQTFIHRLVAQAFIPNPENKHEVDHIDGNRQNNYVNNLRWVTHRENCLNPQTYRKMVIARKLNPYWKGKLGEKNKDSKPVICVETGVLYWGGKEAQRKTGIWATSVTRAVCGEQKTAGGYHWRSANEDEIKRVRENAF